eukprot:2419731-Amphidinium_carterae.1
MRGPAEGGEAALFTRRSVGSRQQHTSYGALCLQLLTWAGSVELASRSARPPKAEFPVGVVKRFNFSIQ